MSDLRQIFKRLGGIQAIAAATGVHRTRVYAWMRQGQVPQRHIPHIMTLHRKAGYWPSPSVYFGLEDGS